MSPPEPDATAPDNRVIDGVVTNGDVTCCASGSDFTVDVGTVASVANVAGIDNDANDAGVDDGGVAVANNISSIFSMLLLN